MPLRIKAIRSFETQRNVHPMKQDHISETFNILTGGGGAGTDLDAFEERTICCSVAKRTQSVTQLLSLLKGGHILFIIFLCWVENRSFSSADSN